MAEGEAQYTVGAVARGTGLSPHVLRAWERRYGVVEPERSAGGTRLYSAADVLRLRLLRRVTAAGMGIAQATKLSTEELLALVRAEPEPIPLADAAPQPSRQAELFIAPVLAAIEAMDASRMHAALLRAAVTLGAYQFAVSVAVPLLREVGASWESGALCPAHEHLFSVQLRRVLVWLLESLPVPSSAPGVVATTPSGQAHELGVLLAAVVSAGEGWRVSYFGPELPPADIATAVDLTRARAILLSVLSRTSQDELLTYVGALQAALPAGVVVLVGGCGVAEHAEALATAGATWLRDLDELVTLLRTLRRGAEDAEEVSS
jgi:MerR family transcriptional regulator, light-induced transcriptional regulator